MCLLRCRRDVLAHFEPSPPVPGRAETVTAELDGYQAIVQERDIIADGFTATECDDDGLVRMINGDKAAGVGLGRLAEGPNHPRVRTLDSRAVAGIALQLTVLAVEVVWTIGCCRIWSEELKSPVQGIGYG
jgi:hypothetical protein